VGSSLCPVIADFFIEEFEERASAPVTYKLLCWIHYVDVTFVLWPHEIEKLDKFLDHLNGLHRNMQFTMELERFGHLCFLDIDICRRPGGSLGHKVY